MRPIISAIRAKDFATANEIFARTMQTKVARRLAEERKHILKEDVPGAPVGWKKGHEWPWCIGGGGKETPFIKNGKWYLYMWNAKLKKNFYYDFSKDMYIPDSDLIESKKINETYTLITRQPGSYTASPQRQYFASLTDLKNAYVAAKKAGMGIDIEDSTRTGNVKSIPEPLWKELEAYARSKGVRIDESISAHEVQRVFDDCLAAGLDPETAASETGVLLNVQNVHVNSENQVCSYISEGTQIITRRDL